MKGKTGVRKKTPWEGGTAWFSFLESLAALMKEKHTVYQDGRDYFRSF